MSHGAQPVVATAFALAVLLTAGVAAACGGHPSHVAQAPTVETPVTSADEGQTVLPPAQG